MKRTLFWAIVCAGFVLLAISSGGAQMAPIVQTEVGPSPALDSMTVAELEQRGDTLRARLAYTDALTCYRTAIRKSGKNAMLYNKAGLAELQLKDLKGAQKDFERAIKYDRKLADAYNNLGVLFYANRAYGKAVDQLQKAIELNANSAVYHTNLGAALFSQQQVEKAAAEFGRAMDIDPDIMMKSRGAGATARLATPEERAHYFFILAKLYGARGDLDRCLQCLEKAKEGSYPGLNDVYKDKDFEAARRDPRLQEIMSKPQPPQ